MSETIAPATTELQPVCQIWLMNVAELAVTLVVIVINALKL